jgi:hypothetical protein
VLKLSLFAVLKGLKDGGEVHPESLALASKEAIEHGDTKVAIPPLHMQSARATKQKRTINLGR